MNNKSKILLILFIGILLLNTKAIAQCWFGMTCSGVPGSTNYYCAWNPFTNGQISQGCIYSGKGSFVAKNCIMANSLMMCQDSFGNSISYKNATLDCQIVNGQ